MQSSGAAGAFIDIPENENSSHITSNEPTLYAVTAAGADVPVQIEQSAEEQAYVYEEKPVYEAVKRICDVVLAVVGIILASPIMLATAVAIKLEDGGPIIHRRICIGRNRKPYVMYKFRSMVVNANDLEHVLTTEQRKEYMQEVKIKDDPRITKVGRFIRKTSIDELPQLFTVLKGDMSIVGPRPMVEFENQLFGEYANEVLLARPGITGYWQVYGRNNKKYETGERQEMELYYIKNRTLLFDAKLIALTAECVLRCEGN